MPGLNQKIVYTSYEGHLIQNYGHNSLMPIVRVYSDSMGRGAFKFSIPESRTNQFGSLTAEIYKCDEPDVDWNRWLREGDDLYSESALDFSGKFIDANNYKITFKFLPRPLLVSDGDFYSVEFFLTLNLSAAFTISPKIIMNIKDRVTF